MELGSLVKADTFLISPFVLTLWTVIAGLIITDSLSLRVKIGILKIVVSDKDTWNWNGKLSNPPSLIHSAYCHDFHTLLIPLQQLKFPCKPVASLDFYPRFSILVYYSCPSPLVCLKIIPSWHRI